MEVRKHIRSGVMRSWLVLLPVLICLLPFAQLPAGKCEFRNNEFLIEINKKVAGDQLNDFILKYDLKELDLKNVFKTNDLDTLKTLGWKIKINNDKMLVITKPLSGSSNFNNPADNMVFPEKDLSIAERFPSTGNGVLYGYNRFKNKYPFIIKDSIVSFYLRGHSEARRVVLAGSFNSFLPDELRMKKTDSGWMADVKLSPGKYWYKFITDGNWIVDDDNYLRENDGLGNTNSVYYRPNVVFKFNGQSTAKKAYVTGSFNKWKKGELTMIKTAAGWLLPLYLADGTHTYKYIIDNVYYTDTDKFEKLSDGNGGYNSVIRLGTPHLFTVKGFANARQIIVSGSFNNWRKDELSLKKTATGWELPYTLGAGNYQYKFIVDGNWILDPANPLTATMDGQTNSYLTIGANYTFRLKGVPNAKSIFLAGDFNNWDPGTLAMKKKGDEWVCSVYLSAGKHKYKYIVDGKWITDPNNKNWEQNEFGTGNSVVWVEK